MAVLYISEFFAPAGNAPIAQLPPLAQQTVAIGSEADSAVFNINTRFVRVHADAACHIAVGAAPTAATTTLRMAAGSTEYFGVPPNTKLSVVAAS